MQKKKKCHYKSCFTFPICGNFLFLQGAVDAEVKVLLALKADYKSLTGADYKPPSAAGSGRQEKGKDKSKEKKEKQNKAGGGKPQGEAAEAKAKQGASAAPSAGLAEGDAKKQTRLGMEAKKNEDFSEWYSQVGVL